MTTELNNRKKRLEERLVKHGIKEYHIQYLPYLEFDEKKFSTPYVTGCRMMILYAVAYTASELDDREAITKWLKREELLSHVSPDERELLEGKLKNEQKIIDFSWQRECAYILAWALNLIKETPTPTEQVNDQQLDDFMNVIPALGEELGDFLNELNYRDTTEIYDENLFHELATTYFRDLMFNGKKDNSDIDRNISFLRHQTLNWLRRFMDIEEWDETDTST
ncbi:DUF4272 domain-containing protein [Pararhodonellum marinum]|uniref:DUF4272 domain-containing protein n=1 Tax=Pararhodonellum marinum TaxID=2755358 RepID=UPI00188EE89A|nr:DUF4272 domain-containing protein [Pararhodonellum marinum]